MSDLEPRVIATYGYIYSTISRFAGVVFYAENESAQDRKMMEGSSAEDSEHRMLRAVWRVIGSDWKPEGSLFFL